MLRLSLAFILFFSSQLLLANPKVILETNQGNITITLFEKEAPLTVKNFLGYVDDGFYNGTIFHRVIKDFMIQGGGFTKELSKKQTKEPIKNEAQAMLKNLRGTISMARTSAPNTATSQFFINVKNNPPLDWKKHNLGYAVFGEIDNAGMRVVDKISYSHTGIIGMRRDVPVQTVEIIKAYRVKPAAKPTKKK